MRTFIDGLSSDAAAEATLLLNVAGRDDLCNFVGHWPPAFLILGVYNKMVKQNGSDASTRRRKFEPSVAD